jgi:phenylacetate-coenzyme A ligase PaaK-like adenylate-forming protein
MEKEQSGIGEIVGSTFVNSALPLVKYSTGDYGQVFDRNNQLFIKNIKGRWGKDFLYCNDGTRISSTQLNFHEVIFENILYYQIVQFEFNQIKFKILPAERISVNLNDLIEEVANLLMVKLPNFNIEIIVCQSSDFELSTRGKVKMIVQKIQGVEYTKSEE